MICFCSLTGKRRNQSSIFIEGQLFELMARRGRLEAQRDEVDGIRFPEELVAAGEKNPDAKELMDGQSNLFFARRNSVAREIE